MRRSMRWNVEPMRRCEEILNRSRARGFGIGARMIWSCARAKIARSGVEKGEENLGHLVEVLIAKATEDQRARLRVRKLGHGGSQRPCTRRVVRHVEQKIRRQKLESARPLCLANTGFNTGDCNIATLFCYLFRLDSRITSYFARLLISDWRPRGRGRCFSAGAGPDSGESTSRG